MNAQHTPGVWQVTQPDGNKPLPLCTPAFDSARGMWLVGGVYVRSFSEAREAQAAHIGVAKATGSTTP